MLSIDEKYIEHIQAIKNAESLNPILDKLDDWNKEDRTC